MIKRNNSKELCYESPDPLFVAKPYNDQYIALVCALFAYGNAGQIIKFLDSLDFSLLEQSEDQIIKQTTQNYYRFQTPLDTAQFFITLKRLKNHQDLQDIFYEGYRQDYCVLQGLNSIIKTLRSLNSYSSNGYDFLISKALKLNKNLSIKHIGNPPLKRYNMFLRWMVRKDNLDMGLWKKVAPKHLIIPLDTHTFEVSKKLGLLERKTYDLKSALLLTETLKQFDPKDPVKYDFALYRLGQQKINLTQ